jgi:AraC family transcriptional regulator, regulatory protein of adaptative response / methylated-DNA-[protein]-cysteine methyltransferase
MAAIDTPSDPTRARAPGELPLDDARWEAVATRARRAGFVFGVLTTGVYCHPWCPARRPHRGNARAFATPAVAEAAGFRACRRCRPDLGTAHPHDALVAATVDALDGPEPPATLAALAEVVGTSPWHLHRVFRAATGTTPRRYLSARRLAALEGGLAEASSVAGAGYAAGYGSARALYADAGALGVAPAVARRGGADLVLRHASVPTPVGPAVVVVSDRGIVALAFGDDSSVLADVRGRLPRAELVPRTPLDEERDGLEALVAQFFAGDDGLVAAPLDMRTSAFRLRVWETVRAIPRGETRTYRDLAEELGIPAAARAVAGACAANPAALTVPCHRVVRTDGRLAGYRWGVDRKAALLALESGSGW